MMTTDTLLTPYGMFSGILDTEYDADGTICGLRLGEKNVIVTHAGELIPFFGEDSPRRKYKASVTFHKNGMVKAVSLEEQQDVETPIGVLPAELITFYETGEVNRVFPLDGKISGFWSEEDERGLNIPLSFDLGFTSFTAMLNGICFFKSGQIRSLTLYPKATIQIDTERYGAIPARQGFSLYENGVLESFEPALPVAIQTPVGSITAYDVNAHGINADSNSLVFDQEGRVTALVTTTDRFVIQKEYDDSFYIFAPKDISSEDEDGVVTLTLKLMFDYEHGKISLTDTDNERYEFLLSDTFTVFKDKLNDGGCSGGDCANCSLCGG